MYINRKRAYRYFEANLRKFLDDPSRYNYDTLSTYIIIYMNLNIIQPHIAAQMINILDNYFVKYAIQF